MEVKVLKDILSANNQIAEQNHETFADLYRGLDLI